jgi:formate dehydrogenase iron-sulfur subunit
MAEPMGFFTDVTVCIGCKACEVACKMWNQLPANNGGVVELSGRSYDNTRTLDGTTWRHVRFVEDFSRDRSHGRWLMLSDVCKHCEPAPCQQSCPTGSIIYNRKGNVYIQDDICNGCGYCVSACPFGVIGRADAGHESGRAHKCTMCYDRQSEDMVPACAKVCPTASIQYGPLDDLRRHARQRVDELHSRGNRAAYLYGADPVGDYGPLGAFFLLEDHPNEYNLPVNPPQPFRGQGRRYAASLLAGLALTALSAMAFRRDA